MPISQPYYLNGTTLSNSTCIYMDSGLTVIAPDGWYSDGTAIRQLIAGVLGIRRSCPSCGNPCGEFAADMLPTGRYIAEIDTGSSPTSVGAIIIRFNPFNVPDGIMAQLGSFTSSEISSPVHGYLAAPPGLPVYIGDSGSESSCPSGSIIGGPFTLNDYEWNGTSFSPTGNTSSVTVTLPQYQVTATPPGESVMVIPKLTTANNTLIINCYGICSATVFDVSVECPAKLEKFKASVRAEDLEDPVTFCALPQESIYYVASVTGVFPYLGLHDWIFLDPFGSAKAPDGYYKTSNLTAPNNTIRVQNGVITEILNPCI